jgi:hypothetical protein
MYKIVKSRTHGSLNFQSLETSEKAYNSDSIKLGHREIISELHNL